MPKAMQIEMLKKIVYDCDTTAIDWEHEVDATLSLPENRVELSIIHPTCKWFTDEEERRTVKQEALRETEDYVDYLQSIVPPEATEEFKEFFDDYLSRYRYALERKLKTSGLTRRVKELEIELTEAKKRREITPERPPTVRTPPEPRPLTWTTRLERDLRDVFESTFTIEGMSPRRYMPEYRRELEVVRTLTTKEEMIKAVEEHAKEIIRREQALKVKPPRVGPPPEERPPIERRIGLPPEEEGIPLAEAPPTPFTIYPEKPFVTALYPNRLLTKSEIDDIWDSYRMAVTMCGKNPDRHRKEFEEWMETYLFTSWEQVKNNYENLIESICLEKKLKPIPRAPPAEVIDELVHWITSVNTIEDIVDNKPIKRKPKTIEEVIEKLDEMGKPGVPRSDVIAAVKRGWQEKAPNYIIVTKEYLEKLIGEPIK